MKWRAFCFRQKVAATVNVTIKAKDSMRTRKERWGSRKRHRVRREDDNEWKMTA